ncbi:CYTH domain-containing protein [Aciduricibacillus chroicocephali]|uniref:CYTH domain-containing protein n=1 Tax=Aciduricibacillus chroicocephali TaxID=3054939 RepID=A0ABY9KY31_9BACI|nr:CYTH domain-containing protein [Bacillaceae bacterium 44XB]
MAQEIEIEFKNLLSKEEYTKLRAGLPFHSASMTQTNHYFDTEAFNLKQKGSALRIREKNDRFTLTLKEPHPDGLLETHDTLTDEEAASWIEGSPLPKENVGEQLEQLGVNEADLKLFGSLTTERLETKSNGVLLVLDYSTYNGENDYELEIEAMDRKSGQAAMEEVLQEFSIPRRKTPNKIERFYNSMKKK